MIDLSDLQLTDDKTTFFMPAELRYKFSETLAQQMSLQATLPQFEIQIIHWQDIKDSPDLKAKYEKYQQASKAAFDEAGFEKRPHVFYDGVISNIEPNYLFEKLKFFLDDNTPIGTVEDVPDENNSENDLNQNLNHESVTLDIDEDYFDIFGSFEDLQKLSQLMQEKQLTEDDLRIILHAISIRDFYYNRIS